MKKNRHGHEPSLIRRIFLASGVLLLFGAVAFMILPEKPLGPQVSRASESGPARQALPAPVAGNTPAAAVAAEAPPPAMEEAPSRPDAGSSASPDIAALPAHSAHPIGDPAGAPPPPPPDAAAGEDAPAAPPGEKTGQPPEDFGEQAPPSPAPSPAPAVPDALPPAAAVQGALSWRPLVTRLAADGFDPEKTAALFASLNAPPLPEFMGQKAVELYARYGKASLTIPDAERVKFAPPDYTRIAGGMTVSAGRRAMESNKTFFEGLYKRFGVPAPFIVAVMMVETGLGAELGRQSALHALGSMAVTDSLAPLLPVLSGVDKNREEMETLIKARSDWAYNELKALLDYAGKTGKNAATIPGSVYGAIGICQFMPSNIPFYGVATSKKRPVPDLFLFSDAAASVARYLSAHGWHKAKMPSAQLAVLRTYNNSDIYASTVYGVASALMAPTTHGSAESARKGGNAVRAARESARQSLPSGSGKKGVKGVETLRDYSKLLE